ncbi:MAG: antibiotic biosynthesis monooxygenase, partial [Akkermansia sp.]|nr:antibiotic biosynthesis monooxygenase [Akkermansia sp.]
MLIRISEIEVHPQYLKEYLEYASTVGAASVKEESGVICIYPMQMKRDSTQIRILEIYASPEAYRHHIQTAHFQKYKTETLHMVKRLDLVDMHAVDPAGMPEIFLIMNTNK